jgi:PleD family two-component response regulator
MSEILFADDDPHMREIVSSALRSVGHRVRLVADGRAALEGVRQMPPDLVALDQRMPGLTGFKVCRQIKTDPRLEHIPVLILTAQGHVEERIEGFNAGADDYLTKPFDSRELLARVQAMLRLTRQGLDRNPTSGLPGGEAIEREFQHRRQLERPFALCYLDLNDFKPFNDHFGFSAADAVIREVGSVLRDVARDREAFVGHIGGDDFVVLCEREHARSFSQQAQELFETRLANHLPPQVVRAGEYTGEDRDGNARTFPLTRIAAAIIHIDPARWHTLTELGDAIAEAKRRAKQATETGIAEIERLS